MVAASSYDFLTGLLPFLLLFGFWTFVARRVRSKEPPQQQIVDKLEEIRVEIERLRRSLDERETAGFGFRS